MVERAHRNPCRCGRCNRSPSKRAGELRDSITVEMPPCKRTCRAPLNWGVTNISLEPSLPDEDLAAFASSSVVRVFGAKIDLMHSASSFSASSRSTLTSGSWPASRSTLTTSTRHSKSSMPGTSPVRRPPTRTRGRLSHRLYAGFNNRHELPATTPDWTYVDHRPLVTVEANDLPASIRAIWDLTPDIGIYMESVHRLSDVGAVLTHTSRGISHEDFDAEWRMIAIFTVEGDLINRCEMFDEADLDAALARFDELHPQMPRLENAAGRIFARYFACFSARDWAAMAELLADDIVADDRRRVVNAGVRRGRDVYIADNQAAVEVGAETISSSVIATRGERLALAHVRSVTRGLLSGEVGAGNARYRRDRRRRADRRGCHIRP